MANLYKTVPYKGRPSPEDMNKLIAQAEKEYDWEYLKPYPYLLVYWQGKHQQDVLPIARWVSHFRMPFIKSDYQQITVPIKDGNVTYTQGHKQFGHSLCQPNCGTHDYVTGILIEPKLI